MIVVAIKNRQISLTYIFKLSNSIYIYVAIALDKFLNPKVLINLWNKIIETSYKMSKEILQAWSC